MDNQFNREAFLNKASDLLAKTIGVNELNCTIDFDTKLVS